MALYLPASARRRRLIVVAVVAVLVGLGLGWAIGRASAPTVADHVSSTRARAHELDARLQSLPFEYDKARSAGTDLTAPGGPVSALDQAVADTRSLAEDAPWLSTAQRAVVVTAVQTARDGAASGVASEQFQTDIDRAVAAVNDAVGIPPSS